MLRFVLLFAVVLMLALFVRAIYTYARTKTIDWTGVTAGIGFVALAFWLRDITGWG